jgi:hypothetical protein
MMKTKIDQFHEDFAKSKVTVICVKCGSTAIDQNFSTQLACYNCDNVGIWDSTRFSILRGEFEESDAVAALAEEPKSRDNGDWGSAITESLLPFMHELTTIPSLLEDVDRSSILEGDLTRLISKWEDARTRVDAVIADLLSREN